jgi:hypothetical protein
MISEFSEKNIDENKLLVKSTIFELMNKQYFPNKQYLNIKKIWNFIEHSNIFHLQKMYYEKNPYFDYYQNK